MDLSYVFLQKWQTYLLLPSALLLSLNLAAIVYTYPDDFRSFPGLSRNSQEFLDLYKKRVAVEQTIYHLKSYMGSDVICTYDHISIFSDFLLSAITYSLLFILAHNIKLYCSKLTIKKLNKLKKLIA